MCSTVGCAVWCAVCRHLGGSIHVGVFTVHCLHLDSGSRPCVMQHPVSRNTLCHATPCVMQHPVSCNTSCTVRHQAVRQSDSHQPNLSQPHQHHLTGRQLLATQALRRVAEQLRLLPPPPAPRAYTNLIHTAARIHTVALIHSQPTQHCYCSSDTSPH